MKTALELIEAEIQRQIDVYGYTDEHILTTTDDYGDGELAMLNKDGDFLPELLFPWEDEYFKPSPDNRIKELVKAAAMIVREIKRHNSLI